MNIEILGGLKNKTDFNRGDKVVFTEESGASFTDGGPGLVVGEDNTHLHLFNIKSGLYMGIYKAEPNLSILEVIKD